MCLGGGALGTRPRGTGLGIERRSDAVADDLHDEGIGSRGGGPRRCRHTKIKNNKNDIQLTKTNEINHAEPLILKIEKPENRRHPSRSTDTINKNNVITHDGPLALRFVR